MLTRRSISTGLAALAGGGASLALARAAVVPPAKPWPNGARAAISLTYDDALDSQLDNAVGALDKARLKATFFLTRDNIGARGRDWVEVARRGHEIGNHTVTHPCGLQGYTAESYARKELLPMEAYLDAHFGKTGPRIFAFPCSVTDLGPGDANQQFDRFEDLLKTTGFRAARTCDEDAPNSQQHARSSPYRLRASATTYDKDDPRLPMAYVNEGLKHGNWAILVFHEILKRRVGPGDTSITSHDTFLRWLTEQNVWCAPMGAVLDHIGQDA
jgi:peptidoglycan/xylan/chitin deacetylase (PgdA/CDA1 family)